MKEHIIDSPQLQSLHKRINGMLVWAVGWLMWIYLLIPLITLSSWLLGDHTLANEMRWFGGYKSLLELLEIYFITLLVLAVLWLSWVGYHSLRKQTVLPAANKIVNDDDLCAFYQVNREELRQCRYVRLTTVYFDDYGQIIYLKPIISDSPRVSKRPVTVESDYLYNREPTDERAH